MFSNHLYRRADDDLERQEPFWIRVWIHSPGNCFVTLYLESHVTYRRQLSSNCKCSWILSSTSCLVQCCWHSSLVRVTHPLRLCLFQWHHRIYFGCCGHFMVYIQRKCNICCRIAIDGNASTCRVSSGAVLYVSLLLLTDIRFGICGDDRL